jgi:acetyltransferase-like isoleucine patch superfamily enzyme
VGKNVFFAPQVTVMDRSHLDLGDGCFIGNRAYLSPHVVRIKNGKTLVYFKTIRVGRGAFIGFDARIGPGVTIGSGVSVPAGANLYPNEHVATDAYFQKPNPSGPATVKQETVLSH